jgi:Ca2+-binding EF-hand superfamily protein
LERLFSVFDTDRNGFLDMIEFLDGMTILFSQNYERLVQFVFNFYDFDKDGLISKEDLRVVLSYVHLNTKWKTEGVKLKYEK